MKIIIRCDWAQCDRKMQQYHDEEWGVPQHNDQKLFEILTLEGAQAGLSWKTILDRREGYRKAFKNFNVKFFWDIIYCRNFISRWRESFYFS